MSCSMFFTQLVHASGELLLRCGFIAVLAALFWGAGLWLPSIIRTRSGDADDQGKPSLSLQLALGIGGGVMSCVTFWTLSLFIFKDLRAGSVAVLVLGAFCAWHFRSRVFVRPERHRLGLFTGVTVFALMLGLWQFGCIELPTDGHSFGLESPVKLFLFSDRNFDLPIHVHSASLIAESGLPKINAYGLPGQEYSPLVHTGYAVLIAGAHSVTGLTLYQSASCLWILGYLVIVWSALTLLEQFRLPRFVTFVGAVMPLVWGGLGVPPFQVLFGRDTVVPWMTLLQIPTPSGNMYHNFPQVWSVATLAVGLICFDRYARAERREVGFLAATTTAIVVSGWIKPSLAILFGPALLIVLLARRKSLGELGLVLALLSIGAAVYCLPLLVATLPPAREWSIGPSWGGTRRVLNYYCLGGGAALLVSAARIWSMVKSPARRRCDWGEMAIAAAGGGVLFALLFREGVLGGAQPNLLWGLSATFVLFVPYVVAWCAGGLHRTDRTAPPAWLRKVGWALIALQVANGAIYAIVYPTIQVRALPVLAARELERVRHTTTPKCRFLIDRARMSIEGVSYLARPALYPNHMLDEAAFRELRQWNQLAKTGKFASEHQLAQRDAVLLDNRRTAARKALRWNGWFRVYGSYAGAELWINGSRRDVLLKPP